MTGPLAGLRVLELAAELTAYPGKAFADLGAEVVVVEPPGGSPTRAFGPFDGTAPAGPEASLYWRHYNTSKRGIVLDLGTEDGRDRVRGLLAGADVLLEAGTAADVAALGVSAAAYPRLVHASITPFGRRGGPPDRPVTDLTLLAGGGTVFNAGYDDHSLPPVRGAGGQAAHTAGAFAFVAVMTALLHRRVSGRGQYVDVSVDAAVNVTCELATAQYLADGRFVQRQTGRHAMVGQSAPTQVRSADGRYVVLGFPPRAAEDYVSLLEWVDAAGLTEKFAEAPLLRLGVERGGVSVAELSDPVAQQIWNAAREAMVLLAENLPAQDFFLGCQRRGIVTGVIAAPEEAIRDEHVVARGFPTPVTDPRTGRTEIHPGPPYRFSRTPWRISRPAPRLSEHTQAVLDEGWGPEKGLTP